LNDVEEWKVPLQEKMEELSHERNNCSSLLHYSRYDEASDVNKPPVVKCEVFCTLSSSCEG